MSNIQLGSSTGVPMLIVVLAWLSNRADINRFSDTLDRNMVMTYAGR